MTARSRKRNYDPVPRGGGRLPRDHGVAASGDVVEERRRQWLDHYRAHARALGGDCLSAEYRSAHEKLHWRCAEGHEWHAEANSIRCGRWCPTCANAHRHDLKKARMFARVRSIARSRGGACLSTDYVDSQSHLRWRCAEGHEWEAIPGSIAIGRWCPHCAGCARLTIEEMREIAAARGGQCLSRTYIHNEHPLRWRCAEGHEWTALPVNIKQGTWCPKCAGRAPKTIADVQAMAREHGGACLSTTIDSSLDVLRFRCRVGHVFESNANRLQQDQWCPHCRKMPRGTLERLESAVKRRGGTLLETEYVDSQTRVRVRCAEGHEWLSLPTNLIAGKWCRECWRLSGAGRSNQRLSITDMQEVAARRGGRCLSDTYVNIGTKLRWQCHDGHEWDAIPASVRSGHWCPTCAHRHRGTLDGMRALAAERGGRCRSRSYQNHNDPVLFTCARGHEFSVTGMAVKSGAWCPTCGEFEATAIGRTRSSPRRPRGRGDAGAPA